jgi:hypothetical protein
MSIHISVAGRIAVVAAVLAQSTGVLHATETTAPPNNTVDVLKATIDYTQQCQWPNGNMYFKPVPPDFSIPSSFVDHPAGMAENVARCYLYTGDPRALEVMRKAIDFLRKAEPHHAQYIGGKCGEEQFHGMDAHGCWAQSFVVPVVWYYMLTGDRKVIEENYPVIADAYDWHLQHFPFQDNTYNHERLYYWKAFVLAKTVMEMMGDRARAEKYDKTLRLWRDSFDYGWFEPHGLYSQWPFLKYDWKASRFRLESYPMPFYLADRPKVDPFWAYWEYTYTSTMNIYFDSWLIDEKLHARQLKGVASINRNLERLDQWWDTPRYARDGETGDWVVWYLLRFMHEAQWMEKGQRLYDSYFASKGWPPRAEKGFEVSDLVPMADFAHYGVYVLPQFRYPIGTETRLGDTLVMGEFFVQSAPPRTSPAAFNEAGITHHDSLYYGERNPVTAMEDLARLNLDDYRVIHIANRRVGREFVTQSVRLLNWVRNGGSLVLLDSGTDDPALPWLPEELQLVWTPDGAPTPVEVVAAANPLLVAPNAINQTRLREWATSCTHAFAKMAPGWEVAAKRAGSGEPVLVHRRLGKGWICATTLNPCSPATLQPRIIENIQAFARGVSGRLDADYDSTATRYNFPKTLPVLPHLESMAFEDAAGKPIDYPFASNRTVPFAGTYRMKFVVVSPVSGAPATLVLPEPRGYAGRVTLDGTATPATPVQMGDGRFLLLELKSSRNTVLVDYQPRQQ